MMAGINALAGMLPAWRGVLGTAFAGLGFAVQSLLIQVAQTLGMGPMQMIFIGSCLQLALFCAFLVARGVPVRSWLGPSPRPWGWLIVRALGAGLGTALSYTAVALLPLADAMILLASVALWSSPLGWLFLREPISAMRVWSGVGIVVGVGLVANSGVHHGDAPRHIMRIRGIAAALVGACIVAVGYAAVRVLHVRSNTPLHALVLTQTLGLIAAAPACGLLVPASLSLPLAGGLGEGSPWAWASLLSFASIMVCTQALMASGMAVMDAAVSGVLLIAAEVLGSISLQAAFGRTAEERHVGILTLCGGATIIASTAAGLCTAETKKGAAAEAEQERASLRARSCPPSEAELDPDPPILLRSRSTPHDSLTMTDAR